MVVIVELVIRESRHGANGSQIEVSWLFNKESLACGILLDFLVLEVDIGDLSDIVGCLLDLLGVLNDLLGVGLDLVLGLLNDLVQMLDLFLQGILPVLLLDFLSLLHFLDHLRVRC